MAFNFDLSINSSIIDYDIFFIPRFLLQYSNESRFHTNLFLNDLGAFLKFEFRQILDEVRISLVSESKVLVSSLPILFNFYLSISNSIPLSLKKCDLDSFDSRVFPSFLILDLDILDFFCLLNLDS